MAVGQLAVLVVVGAHLLVTAGAVWHCLGLSAVLAVWTPVRWLIVFGSSE